MHGHSLHPSRKSLNVSRSGATAASQNGCACLHQFTPGLRKFLRCHAIYRIFSFQFRQSGIGLCNQWYRGVLCHGSHRLYHLHRPRGAVNSNGIRSKGLQYHHSGLGSGSKQGSSIFVIGQGHHHRQIAGLSNRQQSRPAFLKAHHGFHHK